MFLWPTTWPGGKGGQRNTCLPFLNNPGVQSVALPGNRQSCALDS